VTAFGNKTRSIRKQKSLELEIGENVYKNMFIISPQLVGSVILWSDFTSPCYLVIDSAARRF
jgi:hypothetical protein